MPSVSKEQVQLSALALNEYAQSTYKILDQKGLVDEQFATVLENDLGDKLGLIVIHPLQSRLTEMKRAEIFAQTGIRPVVHTTFDLERRPFWVLNNLIQ